MSGSKRFLALVAVSALMSACVPGSGQATPSPTASAAPLASSPGATASVAGSTAPSFDTSTPVTLTEWDTENEPGPASEMDALNAAFHDKYPNVTIKRTAKAFDDYVATIKLAASAPDAPDIFQGNEGYSVDAALVKAGLKQQLAD